MINRSLIKVFALLFLTSCATGKYAATNKVYKKQASTFAKTISKTPLNDSFATSKDWTGTVNFGMRKPNFVIIHHTAQNSCEKTLETFTNTATQVSAHYVICKDGTIHHMLNDFLRAWHAGLGKWGNLIDVNSASIGIELDNNGVDSFPPSQINSLLDLLGLLKKAHSIPTANFIGHADIAPSRKDDPNVNFPWQLLSQKGFGLWYDDTSKIVVPQNFNSLQALRIIGYDVKDSSAAVKAFNRHFLKKNNEGGLDESGRKVLWAVSKKFM